MSILTKMRVAGRFTAKVFIGLVMAIPCLFADIISFRLDHFDQWKMVNEDVDYKLRYAINEFIPKDQTLDDWSEMITVINVTTSWGGNTAEAALNSLKEEREKNCPGSTVWKVLESGANHIIYENQAAECMGFAAHHELGKILDGSGDRFVVKYTVNVPEMSPEQKEKWTNWIFENVSIKK